MEHLQTTEKVHDELLLHRRVDLLLRTGKLLVESLADTNRVVRNMKRTAAFLGIPEEKLHINVSFTMLMVNVSDGDYSFTKFQRIEGHGVNMTAISAVSKLSWRAIENDYTLDQYEAELEEIRTRKRNYTPWQVAVGAGFACGGFCIQFGCDWVAFLYASIAAIIGMRVRAHCNESGLNHYMGIAIAAFVSTMLAWASTLLPASWTTTPWHPLLACALFIVPGVPLINFVDDMLDNYIQVGIVRAVNTLLMVSAMAFGIAFAVKICHIENFFPTISMVPHHTYIEYAIAAAISAMGFSMIFNIPRRLLWVVAIGGIIAVCTRNFVNLGPSTDNIGLDMGLVMGSFAGSVLVSLIAIKAVHWFHCPNHVLTIPSVIPMIPGVLMYRMLFGIINMNVESPEQISILMKAIQSGITSGMVILCISLGVAIPNIFGRKYIAKEKNKRLKEILADRRARGKFVEW
ncbi:threonine/serine exporter ThrE family protein [uncultured Bacteroides sp.]|uniref:threonine/serine ThrE exporter family protein n=1 Tax=uncultured Bacteroides sp. TaxID=162156 RepID=UPI0025EA7E56|nr:threonine/serine exporter family protein [uncultured Bacteroides sp.]